MLQLFKVNSWIIVHSFLVDSLILYGFFRRNGRFWRNCWVGPWSFCICCWVWSSSSWTSTWSHFIICTIVKIKVFVLIWLLKNPCINFVQEFELILHYGYTSQLTQHFIQSFNKRSLKMGSTDFSFNLTGVIICYQLTKFNKLRILVY